MVAYDDRRHSFESIADEVYEPVRRYLLRRLVREDAEEVLDDVLLTLWRRLDEVPPHGVLPWCYGVARRHVANHRRSHRRRQALWDRLASQPQQLVLDPHGGDSDVDMATAFERLSASDREVLRLWAWEGLEPQQIAAVLGSSVNAATLRLSRAKKKLGSEIARQDSRPGGQIRIESIEGRES